MHNKRGHACKIIIARRENNAMLSLVTTSEGQMLQLTENEPIYIKGMSAEDYHSDPCLIPSLSSSAAAELITLTPRHVWFKNKRLNTSYVEEEATDAVNNGSILHDLILLGETRAVILDFPDFRTNAAKEARDAAIAAGKIPVLAKKWPEFEEIRKALFAQLAEHPEHSDALQGGDFESSLFWHKDGVNFRCRFDHVNFETGWIDDLKTTGTTVEQWAKTLCAEGKDVQAELYSRGYYAYTGKQPKGFRFIVIESKPPYCMAVYVLEEATRTLTIQRTDQATMIWQSCLEHNSWPGYPPYTHYVSMPPWVQMAWEEKKIISPPSETTNFNPLMAG